MSRKWKQYSPNFKFKVALEAAKGLKTWHEIVAEYEIHPMQVSPRKKELLEEGIDLFQRKNSKAKKSSGTSKDELYAQIGRLKMELEWLKKSLSFSIVARRRLTITNSSDSDLSILRQCELIGLN